MSTNVENYVLKMKVSIITMQLGSANSNSMWVREKVEPGPPDMHSWVVLI
jgi:hypothetical protein